MNKSQFSESPSKESIRQLVSLFNQGKLLKVLELSQNLINQNRESFILWNIVGAANNALGNTNKAVKAFKKVTKLNPTYPDGFNNLGATLREQGKLKAAEKACNRAIVLNPNYAMAYYNLGNTFKDQNKLKQATEAFKKAISINPDYIDALNNLGIVFQTQGEIKQALECFMKILQKNANSTTAYFNIGNVLKEQGELSKAIDSFKQALKLNPKYAEAYNNMGNALKDKGDLKGSLKAFRQAVSLEPLFVEAYFNIGNLLVSQDELENAADVYRKVIALEPTNVKAYINLGNVLKNLGKFDEALAALKKARAIEPQNARIYYGLGNAFREQGQPKEALENYKKLIHLEPDNPTAKHMIASLKGENTNTAPKEYVESLFDDFASRFEKYLVDKLGYEVPKTVVNIVRTQIKKNDLGKVLDLGCGTGLLGAEIRKYCEKLEGVDISASMLHEAKAKNIYDKTTQVDIIEYLASDTLDFDYYFSLDVFIYVGNLSEIFRLIKSRNQKKGKLIFSTEHTEEDGFCLEKTGRYSHSKKYIEKLCREHKYEILYFSMTNLRKENNSIILGGIYIVEF